MDSMNDERAFWNGHWWVQQRVAPVTNDSESDIHFPASWSEMGDVVLPDPQGQLPVDSTRLNEAFTNAPEMVVTSLLSRSRPEEIESRVSPWPVESPMSMDDVLKLVDARMTERQVQAFNDDFGGVWHNGPHGIAPHHDLGQCISQPEQLAYRAAVAEPGSQTSGVAVNGVALRHHHLKLPSDNHGATASGSRRRKILNETSYAERSRYQCDECSQSQGKAVTFSCNKDLKRHLRRTAIHNAPPIARCSCGKSVTRKDGMHSHRKYCRGTTVPL